VATHETTGATSMSCVSTPGPQDAREPAASYDVGRPMPSYGPAAPVRATDTQAIVAFVLGIFSVVMIPLLGPVAIVVANGVLRKVATGEIPVESRGLATAGRVLGIIGTVFLGLGALLLVVFVAVTAMRT